MFKVNSNLFRDMELNIFWICWKILFVEDFVGIYRDISIRGWINIVLLELINIGNVEIIIRGGLV